MRSARSLTFALIYSIYLLAVMLPVQPLIIRPLCALNPKRRPAILRWWFQAQADWVLGLARHVGGMRMDVQGELPAVPLIVVMNHQSLFDIPAAVSLMRGPYPVIPTRALYTRWVPGISGLAQLGSFPSLKQSGRASRAEHASMVASAEAVGRGERTMLIYPEGHRSRDGEMLPFMTQGMKLIFRHTQGRPVYLIVVDEAWRIRGFADIALRLTGQRMKIRVLGPYAVPPERGDHESFIASLRSEIVGELARLRGGEVPATPAPAASASSDSHSASVASQVG